MVLRVSAGVLTLKLERKSLALTVDRQKNSHLVTLRRKSDPTVQLKANDSPFVVVLFATMLTVLATLKPAVWFPWERVMIIADQSFMTMMVLKFSV